MQNERISYIGRVHGTGGRQIYPLCQRGGLQRVRGSVRGAPGGRYERMYTGNAQIRAQVKIHIVSDGKNKEKQLEIIR